MKIRNILQFFANPNTQTTGTSSLSAENKKFYEKELIEEASPELVHDQFGDDYPIPKNGGKQIEFRKYDSLKPANTPLTEGVTPDGNSLSVSTVTSTVKQYGDYITISDVLDLTAIDNNVIQASKILGAQAGLTLDNVTRDVMAGGTNVLIVGDRATRAQLTAADTLTPEIFFRAASMLEAMNAPKIQNSYVAIIHPYAAYDLMRSEEWIDTHKYAASEAIFKGEIGKIANVRFVSTSNAKIWKGVGCPTDLAVFGTLVLGGHAYAKTGIDGGALQMIIKPAGAGDDPLNQRSTVGWKAIKTAERLIEQYMIRIESTSKFSGSVEAN